MWPIKFRAIYFDDYPPIIFEQIEESYELWFINRERNLRYPFQVPFLDEDWKLLQFTGLKDCDETEIFEGDIVRFAIGPLSFNLEVKWGGWEYSAFGLYGKRVDRQPDETEFTWDFLNPRYAQRCKVIGNKFEHPELLRIS